MTDEQLPTEIHRRPMTNVFFSTEAGKTYDALDPILKQYYYSASTFDVWGEVEIWRLKSERYNDVLPKA